MTIFFKGQILTTVGPEATKALLESVVQALYQSYPERFFR
jgi:hypothetical protein